MRTGGHYSEKWRNKVVLAGRGGKRLLGRNVTRMGGRGGREETEARRSTRLQRLGLDEERGLKRGDRPEGCEVRDHSAASTPSGVVFPPRPVPRGVVARELAPQPRATGFDPCRDRGVPLLTSRQSGETRRPRRPGDPTNRQAERPAYNCERRRRIRRSVTFGAPIGRDPKAR